MDREVLIAKIGKLEENIKNQSKISQLDIDLQLSCIRDLYDAYLEIKYNLTPTQQRFEEKSEEKETENTAPLSDCNTLSLFDENEEEVTEVAEIEEVTEERIEEEEDCESDEDEDEDEEFEEEDDDEEEFEDEDELPIIEMDAKMDFSIPSISVEPEMESGIDLDDIEFDEDGSEEEEEAETKKSAAPYIPSIPHSRYYGDEIEIENPIPVKPVSVGESFKPEKPSLNEIVSSYKPDESIGSKMQQGNISDLMKSIDMNNKFLFVKELFKGNGSVFTEEINKLNGFNKLNEAIPYLESIKTKHRWDNQSEAYAELYRLVLRKFTK
ncbi:MAG: hypothetical protein FWH36_00620 [Lentimicrobiaceae bacterium]|nr:hypothetical protein [Lentimicrobiaceae bacterium]